ncbi:hypothetical protein QL285_016900 [Trifolium repens]|nr:hypothetical protein QL285_016900 [Trifolium repens]
MEKQAVKNASGSKSTTKKEAQPWRCEENRLRYEENKEELLLTESEEENLGSDLEEFLWTYDDYTLFEEPGTENQKLAQDVQAFIQKKQKQCEAEASESKSKSK